MNIGWQEPCPCGSGKKYILCCFLVDAEQNARTSGTAHEILAAIVKARSGGPDDSIDDIRAAAGAQVELFNRRAHDDFCGLSPGHIHAFIYAPFSTPQIIQFHRDLSLEREIRILTLFEWIAEAIGDEGLKPTARGNLPRKLCLSVIERLRAIGDDPIPRFYRGASNEREFDELHCTRLVAEQAGLIRKYKGKFVLTKKSRKMRDNNDTGGLYTELFEAYTRKFSWAYRDGYPLAEIIQHGFLFTLYLLHRFGNTRRSFEFYDEKFIRAFPMTVDRFVDYSRGDPASVAMHCYSLRSLERFAWFFGLAELTKVHEKPSLPQYFIRKSALLDRFVTFTV